jgi:DNA-binding response OmpR family regulator
MDPAEIARNKSKIVYGVDDNMANLSYLQETLTEAGYPFVGFTKGLDCISAIFRVPPKLILLDVQMPMIDGFETCRRLRALPEGRTIPVAFLTGLKTREYVRAGVMAGGNDFIIKPFDKEKLLERVAMWTSRRIEPVAPQR